jgi:hypothetical protein
MKQLKIKVQQAWDENPLAVMGVAAAIATVAVKVVEARTSAKNAQSWKKEVNRRATKNA